MSDKDIAAKEIVKRYALYSAGAGLIPMPLVDFAAITAINVKMVKDLGTLYGLEFSQDRIRPLVGSVIAGYSATQVGYGISGSAMKTVPVLGTIAGVAAVPAAGAAVTYAVGRVFIQHFASGGTFLDLDPDKVRAYFSRKKADAAA